MIDAGPSKEIVPELKRLGIKSIDLAVVSHHHADHYGGMDAVIRAFHPRIFLDNGSSHTTPNYLKLLRLVRDSGMRVIFAAKPARKIELGSVSLTVLPQSVQKRETLGGEAGQLERRGCYAPSSDCTVFRGNYCL